MKTVLKALCLAALCGVLFMVMRQRVQGAAPAAAEPSPTAAASASPAPTPEPTPTPTPEPTPEYFTLSCIGDLTLTTNQFFSPESSAHYAYKMNGDYAYPFSNTIQYFEDDEYTLANLECTFSDEQIYSAQRFYFLVPSDWVQIISAGGVDFLTTANNHSMDFFEKGMEETRETLDAAGIPYGLDGEPTVVTTPHGLKLGIYCGSYKDSSYVPNTDAAVEGVRQLQEAGADYVICMFHWGEELHYTPSEAQVALAHACIDAGADLIYGSHPHCLQPVEEYNGGVILYSMANWSFGGSTRPTDRDTAIAQITLMRDTDGSVTNAGWDCIPCSVSSNLVDEDNYNDYKPTPYEPGTELYNRAMSKLLGAYEGSDINRDYSDIDASYGGGAEE